MSQAEPLRATFSRDEIEKRINESLEREGEVNREFTDEPSIQDLIYDELRNIHGLLQDRLGQDGVLDSIDDRICETNSLLFDIKSKQVNTNELRKVVPKDDAILEDDYGKPLMTQKDVDEYMKRFKDYWFEPEEEGEEVMKKVKLAKDERHIIYQALGSRVSTMRNQMGYSKYHSKTTAEEVERDTGLEEEIDKHKKLIYKLKKS
jgi:hypothetical protein